MPGKTASTATKVFVKAPLKTLVYAAGAGGVVAAQIFGAALGNSAGGHIAARPIEEWVKESCKSIDDTYGK